MDEKLVDPTIIARLERPAGTLADELIAAADPFKRVLAINHPWLNNSDDMGLRDFIPGVWPTWGEYKRLMTAISLIEELRKSHG